MHNVTRRYLIAIMNFWQNSTPFFGVTAFIVTSSHFMSKNFDTENKEVTCERNALVATWHNFKSLADFATVVGIGTNWMANQNFC